MNIFAYAALLLYPAVSVILFLLWKPQTAVFWTYLLGWLYLPLVEINFPGVPNYGKSTASNLFILPFIALFDPGRLVRWRTSWVDLAVICWIASPFISSLANNLGAYDGMSGAVTHLLTYGVPYIVGKLYLSDVEGYRGFVRALIIAAAFYTPLMLVEMRLSPQIHQWVYGMGGRGQYSFSGLFGPLGWTPTVFMNSAFEVSLLFTMATLFAFWEWQGKRSLFPAVPFNNLHRFAFFGSFLILCKKFTGLSLSLIGIVILSWRPRLLCTLFACLPILYATLFITGAWRGEGLRDSVATFSEDRAASLQYRLDNDKRLVERALIHPVYGWSGYGRNRIYDINGRDISITDSMFLLTFGTRGLVGLISSMTMFLGPVFTYLVALPNSFSRQDASLSVLLPMAVILVLHSIDNLFNAFPNPIYPMLAGGLAVCRKSN
ncbi:MAG: hypothetical protein NTU79_08585 [Planctomycetota bacterium]|nr:hypothetical protein [Planctomycetota bacterium]